MSFSTAGGGPSAPQMNVTPLIDVLLVLIIVFLLVVVEQQPVGLRTEIPQPNPRFSRLPPVHTLLIRVFARATQHVVLYT